MCARRGLPVTVCTAADVVLLIHNVRVVVAKLMYLKLSLTAIKFRTVSAAVILHFLRYSKYGPSRAILPWSCWFANFDTTLLLESLLFVNTWDNTPIDDVEYYSTAPTTCWNSWGIRKDTQSIFYWYSRFHQFDDFVCDIIAMLGDVGDADKEIDHARRLHDKYIKVAAVWPNVGKYLQRHTLRSVLLALSRLGWCNDPVTDFGFVDLLDSTLVASKFGYKSKDWNNLPFTTREFLKSKGMVNAGLHACELKGLQTLAAYLRDRDIHDANAYFCEDYGYYPVPEDGIFATPDRLMAKLIRVCIS